MSQSARSALRHRDFSLLLVALLAEAFALQMSFVAIGWQVYSIRGRALDLGLLGLAEFLPLLLLALPMGQLADRVPRRHLLTVMMLSNLVVLSGLLGVTIADSQVVWPFFALAFVQGVGSAIGAPAGRALTPSLVPEEILVSALAQRSIVLGLSSIVAPAVGGLLFAVRAELVYSVAIVLAVIALVGVLALRSGREPATESATGLDEVLAGVRLIRRTDVLLGAISLDLFAVLFGGAVALLPIFAKDILEVGPTGLGLLRASPAVGSLIAAALIARYPIRRHAGPKLFFVVAGFGACMVAFGLSRTMWLSMLALALGAGLDMVSVVLLQTLL